MADEITFPTRELNSVVKALVAGTTRDAAYYSNNILSNICRNASSGRRKFTPAASASDVSQDLRKQVGTWKERRGGRLRRNSMQVRHALAIRTLKARGEKPTWERIKIVGDQILKSKQASRSYLRAGFLWPAAALRDAADKLRPPGSRARRGFARGKASSFGGGGAKSKRLALVRTARRGLNPVAVAENLTASLVAARKVDPARFIYSNGNPARLRDLGQRGLNAAARFQLGIERRTMPKVLERSAQIRIGKALRGASRIIGS